MKIAITGANGFVGASLAASLLAKSALRVERLLLIDAHFDQPPADPRAILNAVDISAPGSAQILTSFRPDVLFHLAAVPGGLAEREQTLGWRVNLEATRAVLSEVMARALVPPRLVFTSSIAVFGVPTPPLIDDATIPQPSMSYGAQKLMIETWLNDCVRRGLIDARMPRLPGIIARPEAPSGLISAFMSNVFHRLLRGEPFEFPVSPSATAWFMSRRQCVANLIHAASLEAEDLPLQRAWTLPALRVSMADLSDAVATYLGRDTRGLVSYRPDTAVQAQFGSQPPLASVMADKLGFRHDGSLENLVRNVMEDIRAASPQP